MKAIILAGGLGTRLQSRVPNTPKPLAPISNRPFLEYQMDYWIEQGIDEFYLSIGYLADQIRTHFKESYKGVKIHYIQETHPLGTGGAILHALKHLEDACSDVCILNGDTFVEVDFKKLLCLHHKQQSFLTIALRRVEKNDRYSGVVINQENKIIEFAQRDGENNELLINAGIYLIKPSFYIEQTQELPKVFSVEDDFFPFIVKDIDVYGFVCEGRFIDIGVPKDYERATEFFKDVSKTY